MPLLERSAAYFKPLKLQQTKERVSRGEGVLIGKRVSLVWNTSVSLSQNMPNLNYNRGRYYEYRRVRELEEEGYFVLRMYASKGPFDIIAFGPNDVRIEEIKSFKDRPGDYSEARARLRSIPKSAGLGRFLIEYGPRRPGKPTPR